MSSVEELAPGSTAWARRSYLEQLKDRALREDPARTPDEVEVRANELFIADRVHAGRASGIVRKRQAVTALAVEQARADAIETAELLLEILRTGPDMTKVCPHVWPAAVNTEAQCEVCGLAYIEFT